MYILYGIRMYKYGLHIYIDITMTYQGNQEYTVYSHVFTNFFKMIICCVALRCWERTPASRSTETNQRPLPQRLLVVDLMVSYLRQKRFFGWRMDLIQCLRCWFFFANFTWFNHSTSSDLLFTYHWVKYNHVALHQKRPCFFSPEICKAIKELTNMAPWLQNWTTFGMHVRWTTMR